MERKMREELNALLVNYETDKNFTDAFIIKNINEQEDYYVEVVQGKNDKLILFLYKGQNLKDKAVDVSFDEVDKILNMFEKGIQKEYYEY